MIDIYQDEPLSEESWINLIVSRFTLAENARKAQDDIWDECYRLYRFYQQQDEEYWYRSQYFFPEIFALIESLSPDVIEASIGSEDFFGVGWTKDEDQKNAKNMEDLIKYQLKEKIDFFMKALHWIRTALKYGNGIVKVWWWKETKEYTYRLPPTWVNFLTGKTTRTERKYIYNDPKIGLLDYANFYPDPYGEDIDSCRYVIERKVCDYEHLIAGEREGYYENIAAVKETEFTGAVPAFERLSSIGINTGISNYTADKKRKFVELLEYWEDGQYGCLANRKVMIKKVKSNPYWHGKKPYAMLINNPQEKEFWGIGEILPCKDSQYMFNDSRNLRLDRFNQVVNQMFIGQRGKGIEADQAIWRPSGIIWSDDINALKPVPAQDIPQAIATTEEMKDDIERYSGTYEYARGATPQRSETATGIIRLQGRAMKRFGLKIKIFRKTGMRRLLELILKLNQQFLPEKEETLIRLFGEGGYEAKRLTPWDVQGELDVMIDDPEELVGQKERFLAFYDRTMQNPIYSDPQIRFELERRFIDAMGLKGGEKIKQVLEEMKRRVIPEEAPPEGAPVGIEGELRPTEALGAMNAPVAGDIGAVLTEAMNRREE